MFLGRLFVSRTFAYECISQVSKIQISSANITEKIKYVERVTRDDSLGIMTSSELNGLTIQ